MFEVIRTPCEPLNRSDITIRNVACPDLNGCFVCAGLAHPAGERQE
jgi:hypothetical protein